MINRIALGISVRLLLILAAPAGRLRDKADGGMETADKILWAAAITVVAGAVGAIFKTKLTDFANGLTVSLGW